MRRHKFVVSYGSRLAPTRSLLALALTVTTFAGCDQRLTTPAQLASEPDYGKWASTTEQTVTASPAVDTAMVNDTIRLSASVKTAKGSKCSSTVTWSSLNTETATVSSSGLVTGKAAGIAMIMAAAGCAADTAAVHVQEQQVVASAPSTCSGYSYSRLLTVSTAVQLSDALSKAQPGDLIRLSDGTYPGRFTTTASGTADKPIVLCGSEKAVIDAGSITSSGYALVLKASHWTLDGFTITNAQQGIRILGGQHNLVRRLRIHHIGQEAVNIKAFSSHNIVEESRIHDTGLYVARYGEGVYVGSYNGHWCEWTNCQPDRSDSNLVRNNTFGPNIGAEMVDVKEGTTGTLVSGNTFDGTGRSAEMRSWVGVFGNEAVVSGNKGSVAAEHGFRVEEVLAGWGQGAKFRDNVSDLAGASGYGFRVGAGPSATVTVSCVNSVSNAGSGFSNVKCTS